MNGSLRALTYGAAVGDALGVPFEFLYRGEFVCTDMVGEGSHHKPAGTFSDDTSMLLATADSLRVNRGWVNIEDMRDRYKAWLFEGKYTADGDVFDVGRATYTALERGRGCTEERSNGNGSLMRIAPLACTRASDDDIRAVSAIKHAHRLSTESCVIFVHLLRFVMSGKSIEQFLTEVIVDEDFEFLKSIPSWSRDQVRSSGFVIATLGAAIWCALNTTDYRSCVLEAVNLGSDTDTTACVAGAWAAALYGYADIPKEWIEQLRGKDVIESCLF